MGVHTVLTR